MNTGKMSFLYYILFVHNFFSIELLLMLIALLITNLVDAMGWNPSQIKLRPYPLSNAYYNFTELGNPQVILTLQKLREMRLHKHHPLKKKSQFLTLDPVPQESDEEYNKKRRRVMQEILDGIPDPTASKPIKKYIFKPRKILYPVEFTKNLMTKYRTQNRLE